MLSPALVPQTYSLNQICALIIHQMMNFLQIYFLCRESNMIHIQNIFLFIPFTHPSETVCDYKLEQVSTDYKVFNILFFGGQLNQSIVVFLRCQKISYAITFYRFHCFLFYSLPYTIILKKKYVIDIEIRKTHCCIIFF